MDLVPLISSADLPFDALGGSPSGYNYTGIASAKIAAGQYLNIKDVTISRNVTRNYTEGANPEVQASFVDFSVQNVRQPSLAVGAMNDVTGNPTPGY